MKVTRAEVETVRVVCGKPLPAHLNGTRILVCEVDRIFCRDLASKFSEFSKIW
jgi:hypothetical protein